jgi:hypothetical protein
MKILPLPPLELLEEYLEIDETSPSGLRWKKVKIVNQKKPGDVAGYLRKPGNYWFVGIKTDKVRQYGAHRIVFYLKTGTDPQQNIIDHKEGLDDPLTLRIATSSQNGANAKKCKKKTTSKYKGVHWRADVCKWRARITVNRKRYDLGSFETESAAATAYNEAALKYFGEFARLNNIKD